MNLRFQIHNTLKSVKIHVCFKSKVKMVGVLKKQALFAGKIWSKKSHTQENCKEQIMYNT